MTDPAALSHDRAFELLPWLANGTLPRAEREAVEQHARSCIACRRELKDQQALYAAARARRTADVSAEAGFERLTRALDTDTAARPRWRARYATAAPFAAAAAAGLAVLAILLWFTPLPELGRSDYSTLATPAVADTALVDVVFSDDTTAAEMQQLLDDIGGEIVAGPSAVGRYSVRVASVRAQTPQLDELVRTLLADPRIRFAGRTLSDVQP